MSFFDNAQEMLDRGVSAAKGAVSGVAVEQQGFVKGFSRLCSDGWSQGWHEGRAGSASYRLSPGEVSSCRSFFYDKPSSWVEAGLQEAALAGEFFLATAAGSHLRETALDVRAGAGIVEVSAEGTAWRIVWGFKGGGLPTTEFPTHFAVHGALRRRGSGDCRVLYHAHPSSVVALSLVLPPDARSFTLALWQSLSECVAAFPKGLGVLPWTAPGGVERAQATVALMGDYDACVWAHRGLLCAGADFNAAFGLMHTIEKAAGVYAQARAMSCGSERFASAISKEGLRALAAEYRLEVNEAFLS